MYIYRERERIKVVIIIVTITNNREGCAGARDEGEDHDAQRPDILTNVWQ